MGKTRFPGITFNGMPLEKLFVIEEGVELRDEIQSQERIPLYHKPLGRVKSRRPRPSKVRIIKKGDTKMENKFQQLTKLDHKVLYRLIEHGGPIDKLELAKLIPGAKASSIGATLSRISKLPWITRTYTNIGYVYEVAANAPTFDEASTELSKINIVLRREIKKRQMLRAKDETVKGDSDKQMDETYAEQTEQSELIPDFESMELPISAFIRLFEQLGYDVNITITRRR